MLKNRHNYRTRKPLRGLRKNRRRSRTRTFNAEPVVDGATRAQSAGIRLVSADTARSVMVKDTNSPIVLAARTGTEYDDDLYRISSFCTELCLYRTSESLY